jgi:acyl transferase domain-containing protein
LEGETRAGLMEACRRLQRFVSSAPAVELKDIAFTCHKQLRRGTRKLGVVASSVADLDRKLVHALIRLEDPTCTRIRETQGIYFFEEPLAQAGDLAFMFPGEGSQYGNMLADLCIAFPEARSWFDLMDRAFLDHRRNLLPSQLIFPPPQSIQPEAILFGMDCGPEAVFAASQAMLAILNELRIRPHAVVGHSTGEYSAFIASGANRITDVEQLARAIRELNSRY